MLRAANAAREERGGAEEPPAEAKEPREEGLAAGGCRGRAENAQSADDLCADMSFG